MSRIAIVILLPAIAAAQPPPATPRVPVTDTYHGESVTEDYRWLEDWNEPQVRQWSAQQNAHARHWLDALPGREALTDSVTAIMSASTSSYSEITPRNGAIFALRKQPPKEQPFLVVMKSADDPDTARVRCDPVKLDPNGTLAIDWYEPSPDGSLVAVSLSQGGSEAGDVQIFEVSTGGQVYETVPRVNTGTAGGDLAWSPDGTGFFYTRHPRPGERDEADLDFFQQLYFHELGTGPGTDRYELGRDFPRVAEIELEMHASGQLLATVQNGDGGEFAHYLRGVNGEWRQFSQFDDGMIQATFGSADDLFVLTRDGAPRGRIIRLSVQSLDPHTAPTIVPESEDTIVNSFYRSPPSILATPNRLPRYNAELKVLLDAGVIYAVANIRGGGEFGEAWHRDGMLTKKQNVFDDFAAAAEYLIARRYTSPDKLATLGGSDGGLLMGAMLTQHPQLMRCVVAHVGIYDMLRVELSANGVFNIPEFGTVTNPEHFAAMHAYSPYHRVVDSTAYPSVLFLTGENDPRVDPMQSRKMTARLQAATSSGRPILLRTSSDAGHGADTPLTERIAQTVDVYGFLLHELQVGVQP